MIRLNFLSLLFISLSFCASAQSVFQQKVNHKINVELDTNQKKLLGSIKTTYINNSPDTLSFIYYHLWPNAYKDTETSYAKQQILLQNANFYFSKSEYKGSIECVNIQVNSVESELKEAFSGIDDIKLLPLPEDLFPGDTIIISMDFSVSIPVLTSRMGWRNNDFCLTQWYPKPAVYDQYGWHPMSYLDMGEFYSEFGDFEVSISLPDNYIVAASGDLTSRKELHRLEDYAELCKSSKYKENIRAYGDSTKMKTVNYVCTNVHDFAWFTSPDFVVEMEPFFISSQDKYVRCWAFYNKENADLWDDATKYIGQTVNMMSYEVGSYPYNNCSAVDAPLGAGGGMEYPTITVVTAIDKYSLERVIAHEVIHNWFYGMLASNERNNSWIDEGFTSFYESKYFDRYYPNLGMISELIGKDVNIHGLNEISGRFSKELAWSYLISENIDQPAGLNSEEMSPLNYFILSYYKPVVAIYSLEKYLGEELFRKNMNSFYNIYHHTHIYPEDLRSFNLHGVQDISWFFDDFILENNYPDYKICGIKKDSLIVKNKGESLSPLFLNIGDSSVIVDGFEGSRSYAINNEKEFSIDPDFRTLDLNRRNNYFRKGFLKCRRPVKLSLFNIVDNPKYFQIPIAPIVTYNSTDGWSPGIMFYTSPLPKKKFEFQLLPVWGTKTNMLNGYANFSVFIHPAGKTLREIEPFVSGRKFGLDDETGSYFYKVSSGLKIKFQTDVHKNLESELLVRNISASDYYFDTLKNYQQIKYRYADYNPINPWSIDLDIQNGIGFTKMSAEYKQFISYNKRIGLSIRIFAGKFLYSSDEYYGNYNFRLYGNTGSQDYFYDHLFLGRNEDIRTSPQNIWAHQFIRNDGGFTLYSPYGQTDNWLIAINVDSGTPLGVLDVYFNLGLVPSLSIDNPEVFYETGLKLKILKDFLCVYFPITGTAKVWETSNDIYTDNYLQKVRFTLSLDKLNLLNYRSKPYLLF